MPDGLQQNLGFAMSPGANSLSMLDEAKGAAPLVTVWNPFQLDELHQKSKKTEATVIKVEVPVERQLFGNRASLKIATSQVAMHLTGDQRRILFSELDRLLDIANWEDESALVNLDAFRTFLRFMIFARAGRIPNLGVDEDGSVLASWHGKQATVFAEFAPGDQCVAMIKSMTDRGPESLTWSGPAARLRDVAQGVGARGALD